MREIKSARLVGFNFKGETCLMEKSAIQYFEIDGIGFSVRVSEADEADVSEDETDTLGLGDVCYQASFWKSGARVGRAGLTIQESKGIAFEIVDKRGKKLITEKENEFVKLYGLANMPIVESAHV